MAHRIKISGLSAIAMALLKNRSSANLICHICSTAKVSSRPQADIRWRVSGHWAKRILSEDSVFSSQDRMPILRNFDTTVLNCSRALRCSPAFLARSLSVK